MKDNKIKAFIGFFSIFCMAFLAASSSSAFSETNQPPQAQPIHAQLVAPVTYYYVEAMDPENDTLFYSWKGNLSCGVFNAGPGASASWSHPNTELPNGCPHDQGVNHLGDITVQISDGNNHTVECTYEGSESGNGPLCSRVNTAFGNFIDTANPPTNTSSDSPVNYIFHNYNNTSYYGDEWILILIIAGFLWWWFRANGLFVTDLNDPCAGAREAERNARARKNAAQQSFDALDTIKKTAEEKEQEARDAEKEAQKAIHTAGGRWSAHGSTNWEGAHTEIHREGWQNKELGEKADTAIAHSKKVHDEAQQARDNFDNQGGSTAWSHAKDDLAKATKAWQELVSALQICLDSIAEKPKPEPKPESTPTPTTTTTVEEPHILPVTQSGEDTPTPKETKKEEPHRVCEEGVRRNTRTQAIDVELLDLQSTRLMQDRIYSDTGNEAMKFVDWLQTVKDTFMVGKRLKGGIEGYLDSSLTGTADAVNLPDFLTWYDEATNLLTQSMHQLHTIMKDKQQLGDYWLEYTTKSLTITCSSYEICSGNHWVKHCELSIQDNGSHQRRTDPEQVFDVKELHHIITRLFLKLRNRYRGDTDKAKKFTDSCNACLK